MSDFASQFGELLHQNQPRPTAPQVQGLQQGTVIEVVNGKATFTLETNPRLAYGPAPFGRTSNPPQVGDICLVAFIGMGVDRAWLLSWQAPDQ